MPLMAAKSFHSAAYRKQTLEEKCKRVGFQCVISQLLHGGDLSTCPSRNITKSVSISIVNPTHLNVNLSLPIMQSILSRIIFFIVHIVCHNENIAIDYIVKVHIFVHIKIYAFDLSLLYI